MKYALWIVQALLAFAFTGSGTLKIITPYAEYVQMQPWAEMFAPWMINGIGTLQILGAIGLILPALTRIRPTLTAWAATGLAVLMIGAVGTHVIRSEWGSLVPPTALTLLAGFVAFGRFRLLPIASRTA